MAIAGVLDDPPSAVPALRERGEDRDPATERGAHGGAGSSRDARHPRQRADPSRGTVRGSPDDPLPAVPALREGKGTRAGDVSDPDGDAYAGRHAGHRGQKAKVETRRERHWLK